VNLTDAQKEIARDTHRFRVLNCGRRFGKTTLAAWEMMGVAVAAKDRRIAYYAPTLDDAREIMWGVLVKIVEPLITYRNDTRLELRIRTKDGGESSIHLYGWEAVQHREKGRGVANDFIVLDEAAKFRDFWVGWDNVLSPTLLDRKGSALFISTPQGFNHFYDLSRMAEGFDTRKPNPDFRSFHFTTYDNPHIPKEEIERERLSKPEDSFAQEYLADFRKMEGLVYKEFDRTRHLFDDLTPIGQIIDELVPVDFGFTNPAAVLYIKRDFDNTFWVMSEWYQRGKTDDETIEYAKSLKATAYYPDPENASGIEKMRRLGMNVREVNKDVIKGIDAVRQLFRNDKIRVHFSCKNLISELETYRYPEKRANNNEPEKPVKEFDHALDSLRYAVFMNAPVELEIDQDFNLYSSQFN
jgi:hypothetical protein